MGINNPIEFFQPSKKNAAKLWLVFRDTIYVSRLSTRIEKFWVSKKEKKIVIR